MKNERNKNRPRMISLVQLVLRNPKLTAAVFVCAVLILSLGIAKVEFVNQIERDLPETDPILETNRRFEEVFGEEDLLMVALVNDEGIYNVRTLTKLLEITRELEEVNGVIAGSVKSLCTVNNISASGFGLHIAPFFENPPRTEEEVSGIKKAVAHNRISHGRLVSRDGTATVLRANLAPDHEVEKVYEQTRSIATRYSGPERIYVTGDTIVDYEVTGSIRKDLAILFPASLLLAVAILFIAFQRFGSVVVPCMAVVATVAAALGLMGITGMPVTVVGSILPVVIVAVVGAYGIHIVNAFTLESAKAGTRTDVIRRTMHSVGGPVKISAITSAIGFGSLVIFKMRSIHDFGLILAVAILFGLCSALILIPSVLALLPFRGLPDKVSDRSRFVDWLVIIVYEFVERYRRPFMVVAAMGFLLAIVAMFGLTVGLEPAKFFPEEHPTRQSLDIFNEKLGGSTCFKIMVEAKEPDGIVEPEMLRMTSEFQEFAESQEHVGYVTSFVDVISRLHLVFGEADERADQLPTERSQVAQYLLLYGISGDPADFEDIVDYDCRRAKLVVMLNTYDDAEHLRLYEKLKEKAAELFGSSAEVEFGGRAMILLAQDHYIVVGKILNIICSLIIVWLVCMLYFRSLSGGLLCIIPLGVSTVYTFGLMALMGIRLNVATAMTTGIAVGVGVDFAVHYIHRFRDELARTGDETQAVRDTLLTAGKGIIFNTLSVSFGFLVFLGSRFQVLRDFGWLIALTML
ncbi:MAG: MMPL family transporter, partial [Candidatus Hydrogenedentota bacterium]